MFAGHFAAGFAAKALDRRIPLWALLLAALLLDILWSLFLLLGLERIAIVPELTGSPIELRFAPFSHSLTSAGIWALVIMMGYNTFVQYRRLEGSALVMGLVVVVHWFFDLVVHRPDLPLYGTRFPVGLGLWEFPTAAFALEALLLVGGVAAYLWAVSGARRRVKVGVPVIAGVLLAIQAAGTFGPPPPDSTTVAVSGVVMYAAVVVAAAILERGGRERSASTGVRARGSGPRS